MSELNCDIKLTFYEIPAPRFSYSCTSCSMGWTVQSDGSIHPPSRSRVIRITVEGYPDAVVFAGFQVAESPDDFPADSVPWSIPAGVGVTSVPTFPPTPDPNVLTLTFTGAAKLFYRLAVRKNSSELLYWDDPKIYNDADE